MMNNTGPRAAGARTRRPAAAKSISAARWIRSVSFPLVLGFALILSLNGVFATISGPDSGLLAHYTFDQASGATAPDSSGNRYDGTLVSGPVWSAGRIGSGALLFDNVNDRVSVAMDVPGAEGTALTVSAWVKPSTIADGGVIVAKDRSGFTQWTLRMDGRSANNAKNNLIFTVGGNAATVSATSDAEVMADLNWHHVAGVYDGARVYVFLDGVSVDSSANPLTGTIKNYPHQVCIGTSGTTCNENAYFGGLIDDVRVYSRALAPAELRELYAYNGTTVPPAPDTHPPTVAITAPAQGAQVSGTVSITAAASDDVGVAGVQFAVDGVALQGEDTIAPYAVTWNSTTVTNGTHTLRASARDAAGNATAAVDVAVTVTNYSDTAPPSISNLTARATATSATITWNTDEPADGQVEYGRSSTYGSQNPVSGSLTLAHSETVSGLAPSTEYHYRVTDKDAAGNLNHSADATFVTAPAPPATILAHYAFDETSGTSATDSSGHGYTGTVNGPVWSAGHVGSGALYFDNANDRVSLPLDVPGAEGTALTVSAWVKPSTIADNGVIVAKDRSGFTQWSLKMDGRSANNARNNLIFTVGASATVSATSDNEVMADLSWHLVTGVYDGSQVYVYMDGVSLDSTPNPLTGPIKDYPHQVCVGTSGSTCNESAYFGGLIDDVRVYSRALAPAEIRDLMVQEMSLSEVSVTAQESNVAESGGQGAFILSRTGSLTESLNVSYDLSGTAVNGTDYEWLPGTATFPAGAGTVTIPMTSIDDALAEPLETVIATVVPGQSYTTGPVHSATVTIVDNETPASWSIVIDHTSVELYDDIPMYYIDEAKKMFLNVPGESDSRAYKNGLVYLAQQEPLYSTAVTESGAPEGPRADALRFSNGHWGDVDHATGWLYWYGEEDWFTSDLARERTKAYIRYAHDVGSTISAIGFGWCIDMCRSSDGVSAVDPVYQVRWSGSSVGGPDGNLPWGLDADDLPLTGNRISMDTYLSTTADYQAFAIANGIPTAVFLTTGPLRDTCGGAHPAEAIGYQASLKHERIRQYALEHPGTVLFDFADIMSYNNAGQVFTQSYVNLAGTVVSYNGFHPDNMLNFDGTVTTEATDADEDHIGQSGSLRVGKALWVLMARLAGWDGRSTN